MTVIPSALQLPVPNMEALREQKKVEGYRHLPLNSHDPHFSEPLVAIHELGIAGQPYYSRKSKLLPQPLSRITHDNAAAPHCGTDAGTH